MARKKTVGLPASQRPFLLIFAILAILAIYFFFSPQEPEMPLEPSGGEIRVHYIDVGQGDAILIQTDENAVLIDAGENTAQEAVLKHLRECGVETLDYIVATHPHSDHIGSMAAVISTFNVGELVMPDVIHTTATYERMINAAEAKDIAINTPAVGDVLKAGLIELTVVAPNSEKYEDLNDYSLVLRMVFGETAFLFTGDAEALSEKEIVNAGHNIQAGILKAGHHGSRTSSSNAFLDAVSPDAVIISCGKDNSYGHPHAEMMARMKERNITVLRTDESGTIVLSTDGVTVLQLTNEKTEE